MSRESRRNRRKGKGPWVRAQARKKAMWIKLGGLMAFLAVLGVAVAHQNAGPDHPEPRVGLDHASHVVPASRYEAYPRVAETYRMVAAVPMLVDGVYCYCHCDEHSGHHSLLDCFASDHGARCDICLSEAVMVYQMSRDGHDLEAIRKEIDSRFRS